MSYFLKSGNTFRVSSKEAMDLHEALPPATYVVKYDDLRGFFYLEGIDNFELAPRSYGDNDSNAQRILDTFVKRPKTTGVLLTGEKGSGKTLLAKTVCVFAARAGIPTIVVNTDFAGDAFSSFIQSIEQPCVILFDEFEKVYDSDKQEHILTLLDGVFHTKKLFILTCNDKWRIDHHMRNRPGRIYYMLDFRGLEAEFIREYCQDNLVNKNHTEKICDIASLFNEFNFDMLKALVEEINRYNEDPQTALRMLNIKPEFDSGNNYDVKLLVAGDEVSPERLEQTTWHGNPLQNNIQLDYKVVDEESDDWDWERVKFTHTNLLKIDPAQGRFVFTDDSGTVLTLTKIKEKKYNYYAAF
jgi:hypothetical protein